VIRLFTGFGLACLLDMGAMLLVAELASIGGAAAGKASADTEASLTKKRRKKE